MSYGNQPPAGGGYGAQGGPAGPPPNNHLVPAILVTLFCCLPLGIVSIVKSSQVNSLWSAGDYQGAHTASEEAKKWWKLGLIIGLIVNVIVIIFYVVVVAATVSSIPNAPSY